MELNDISKFISLILRHKPETIGIIFDNLNQIKMF